MPKNLPPKKPDKKFAVMIVVLVCFVAIYVVKFFKNHPMGPGQSIPARATGNPQANIKIVEFMDYQCPACAKAAAMLKETLKSNSDKIYLQIKYYPLDKFHIHAIRAARYAECSARQGKFWPMHELLFEKQEQWREMINPDTIFEDIAKTAGLDMNKLNVCLGNAEVGDVILKDKQEGVAKGVQSTPTFFVNDKMVVGINALEQELMNAMGRVKSSP